MTFENNQRKTNFSYPPISVLHPREIIDNEYRDSNDNCGDDDDDDFSFVAFGDGGNKIDVSAVDVSGDDKIE